MGRRVLHASLRARLLTCEGGCNQLRQSVWVLGRRKATSIDRSFSNHDVSFCRQLFMFKAIFYWGYFAILTIC